METRLLFLSSNEQTFAKSASESIPIPKNNLSANR